LEHGSRQVFLPPGVRDSLAVANSMIRYRVKFTAIIAGRLTR